MVYYDGLSNGSVSRKSCYDCRFTRSRLDDIAKKQAGIKFIFSGDLKRLSVSFVQQNLDLFREVQNWGITLLNNSGQPTVTVN